MAQRSSSLPADRKVLLVGWDSADWKIIDPMLARGELPALAALLKRGVRGNLCSLDPMLSPLIWTSIATGKRPHKHGVLGFVEPDPDGDDVRPVGSGTRKVKALWNILHETGHIAHVVGWFAGHPAEETGGICVSEHVARSRGPSVPAGSVHPPSEAGRFAALRVSPAEIGAHVIREFVPEITATTAAVPRIAKKLEVIADIIASAASTQAAATSLLENEEWDFAAVYFRALDEFGHHFMPCFPPMTPGVDELEYALFSGVMESAYRFHDMMLARLVFLAGADATVILVSDHGFESGRNRPGAVANNPGNMAGWHRPFGVLAMAGRDLLEGEKTYGASVLDITPTVLRLFGLSVGDDMDGKVLASAWKEMPRISRKPTWETPGSAGIRAKQETDRACDAAVLKQLVSLGYVEAPDGDKDRRRREAAASIALNRIDSFVSGAEYEEAEKAVRVLLAEYPGNRTPPLKLVQILLLSGRLREGRAMWDDFRARFGRCAAGDRIHANLLLAENRPAEASAVLDAVAESYPGTTGISEQQGWAMLRSRRWSDAERRFREAIAEEEDSPHARVGLARALARQNRDIEALEMALEAVGLRHFFPSGHFQLGAILSKLGKPEHAVRAFETGLRMAPGDAPARRFIMRLYRQVGGPAGLPRAVAPRGGVL